MEGKLTEPRTTSVLRVLQGISYWVIVDPSEIAELMNTNVRKEWEADLEEHEDREGREWLESLQGKSWRLEVVELSRIRLNGGIMDYSDGKTGYNFRERLEERKRILKRDIGRFGSVIWPLVLRAEDYQLMDGYCRYHALLDLNATKSYTYLGS